MQVSSRRIWGIVALATAAGIAAVWMPSGHTRTRRREALDSRVDDALDDSFPASDPPSFSAPAAAQPGDLRPV
jgi:hypothetical protein